MSKVSLNVASAEIFGSTLPRVFIDKIEIHNFDKNDELRPGYDESDHVKIIAYLNIKFSKPAHVQYESVRDFISNELGNLYLHGFTSFIDEFNKKLENNTFDFKDFIDWREAKNEEDVRSRINLSEEYGEQFSNQWFTYSAVRYRDPTLVGENNYEIKLADLVADENDYESKLSLTNSFDSEGNEIIEIANIVLTFKHKPFFEPMSTFGSVLPRIGNINRMFTLFTVGPTLKSFLEPTFEETVSQSTNVNTFNSYFGDITFYQVLENGVMPNKFYSSYFEQEKDVPYYGPVFMGLNGDFYKTESFSIETMRMRFQDLISKYESLRESDEKLNRNISSLEAIIYADNNTSNILGELSNFRSIYPDKSQEFKSGEFYNEFVILFSDIVTLVQSMPKLTEKVLYDSLLIDLRPSLGEYDRTVFLRAGIPAGVLVYGSTTDSDDYIPKNWFQISRKSYAIDTSAPAGSAARELLNDLVPDDGSATAYVKRLGFRRSVGGDSDSEYQNLLNQLTEEYESLGYGAAAAASLAADELEFQFDMGAGSGRADTANARELFDASDGLESTPDPLTEKDFYVNNRGYFFFDYEKALRTTSNISRFLNLSKLQKYFRFNVPYEDFRMKTVWLIRNELLLEVEPEGEGLSGIAEAASKTVKFTINSAFDNEGAGRLIPKTKYNFYSIDASDAANEVIEETISKQKYGRSVVQINNNFLRYSYVKFINFDVANSIFERRLEGVGSVPDGINYTDVQTVGDGYRLACFEFSDWMDDDVAYKNTIYDPFAISTARQNALEVINNGSPVTNYEIYVKCEDYTYETFKEFRDLILEVYLDFKEYAELSDEICSYNNITNSFNQFYIDGINEYYDGRKPWIRAAYIFTAFRDLLFGGLEPLSPSTLDNLVREQLISIAPETGTREAVQQMLRVFCTAIRGMFFEASYSTDADKPELVEGAQADFPGVQSPGVIWYYNEVYSNIRYFKNRIPIASKIVGEYIPDDIPLNSFELRGPPPTPLYAENSVTAFFDEAAVFNRRMSRTNPYDVLSSDYTYLTYAFEEIFFPRDVVGTDLDLYFRRSDRGDLRIGSDFKIGVANFDSYLKYMLNELFFRSTVDAEIEYGGGGSYYTATAKADGRLLNQRRAFRTINSAISLLELHLTEAERKRTSAVTEIKNPKVLNAIVEARGTATGYRASTRMGIMMDNIIETIEDSIAILQDYKAFYTRGVTLGISSGASDALISADTYRIMGIFNEDDPVGGTFNTAVYEFGLTPSFLDDETTPDDEEA